MPALRQPGLRGALLNWDGQLEDDARLVVAHRPHRGRPRRADRHPRSRHRERLHATARSRPTRSTGRDFAVRARHVVNACGRLVGRTGRRRSACARSKGSHLLVCRRPPRRPGRGADTCPVPGHFGRFVFALPRPDGLVLVGLTDEPFTGPAPYAPGGRRATRSASC